MITRRCREGDAIGMRGQEEINKLRKRLVLVIRHHYLSVLQIPHYFLEEFGVDLTKCVLSTSKVLGG